MVDPPSDRSDSVLGNEITKEVIGLAFRRLLLPHSYHSWKKWKPKNLVPALFQAKNSDSDLKIQKFASRGSKFSFR